MTLSDEEKRILLQLARDAIGAHLRSAPLPAVARPSSPLASQSGAFVSLHKGEELRGCIGYLQGEMPLWEAVREAAVAAATRDHRFDSLDISELPEVTIEVSVLSPMERIVPEEVAVGKHGLYVRQGYRSGLLLPQVATKYGWTSEEFLQHTCHKANLPIDAWKSPGTEIYGFTGEVFSEG